MMQRAARHAGALMAAAGRRRAPLTPSLAGARRNMSSGDGGFGEIGEVEAARRALHKPTVQVGMDGALAAGRGESKPGEEEEAAMEEERVNEETGERGGPRGEEPTRYGDWESKGRCWDF